MDEMSCNVRHESLTREFDASKKSFEERFKDLKDYYINTTKQTENTVIELRKDVTVNGKTLIRIETKVENLVDKINKLTRTEEKQEEKQEKKVEEIEKIKIGKASNLWYPLMAVSGASLLGLGVEYLKKFILK